MIKKYYYLGTQGFTEVNRYSENPEILSVYIDKRNNILEGYYMPKRWINTILFASIHFGLSKEGMDI
jgi:hypothetical protein